MIATKIAQMLVDEGAQSLTEATEDTKTALVTLYLRARDWDVEITLNMRELRGLYGTWQSFIENELYNMAEEAYGVQIDIEMARLLSEAA